MSNEITLVLTSCGRQELLSRTIHSFNHYNTYPIAKFILIEDSANQRMADFVSATFGKQFEIIINPKNIGLIKSIDKAYAKVETPYIFHCEDDWVFFRDGFIQESLSILESDPHIFQVWLRHHWDCSSHPIEQNILQTKNGVQYRRLKQNYNNDWHGFSFNPGLRRLSDYKKIGRYTEIGHELEINHRFKQLGFYSVILEESAVVHIGNDQHILDPSKKQDCQNKYKKMFVSMINFLIPPVIILPIQITIHFLKKLFHALNK